VRFLSPVLQLVFVLLAVAAVTFLVQSALPGDPAEARVGVRPDLSLAQRTQLVAAVRHEFGFDQPLPVQFVRWLEHAVRLDFGTTEAGIPVSSVVGRRLGPTLELVVVTTVVSIPIATALAVAGARRRRRALTRVVNGVLMAGFVTPAFWVGILLILAFAVSVHAFPASGYVSFRADPLGHVRSLVLPAATLVISQVALYYRYLQQGLREAMASQYVRTARAKGLSETAVLYRHALPNALLPMVTILGLTIGSLIGGIIVVERVFGWPGVGSLLLYSVGQFDYETLEAIVLFIAIAYVLLSVAVDLVYRFLDPRIRRA
jgi:peptide/nickel transport system permease protein